MTALLASTGFYTALGGVRASSYIEFIQTLIMVLALVWAVPVVFVHVGGFTPLGEYIGSIDARITGQWFSWRELLAFSLAFGLGIAAAPYEMTRYYSMRDVATVRYAIGVSMILQLIIGACVATLGMGMRGVFPFLPSPDQASSIMLPRENAHSQRHVDVVADREPSAAVEEAVHLDVDVVADLDQPG